MLSKIYQVYLRNRSIGTGEPEETPQAIHHPNGQGAPGSSTTPGLYGAEPNVSPSLAKSGSSPETIDDVTPKKDDTNGIGVNVSHQTHTEVSESVTSTTTIHQQTDRTERPPIAELGNPSIIDPNAKHHPHNLGETSPAADGSSLSTNTNGFFQQFEKISLSSEKITIKKIYLVQINLFENYLNFAVLV